MRKFAIALTLALGGSFSGSPPIAAKSPLCAQVVLPDKEPYLECSAPWERLYVEADPCPPAAPIRCYLPKKSAPPGSVIFIFGGVKNGVKGRIFVFSRDPPDQEVFAILSRAGFSVASLPLHDGRVDAATLSATTFSLKHLKGANSPFSLDLRPEATQQIRERLRRLNDWRRGLSGARISLRSCAPDANCAP